MSKQRYEKEIEEILSKYDQEAGRKERKPPEDKPLPNLSKYAPQPLSKSGPRMPNWKRFSAGQYIVAAFGVAVLAIVVRAFAPGLSPFMVVLAAALFLLPILLYRNTGTTGGGWSAQEEKRWRGQVIDINTRRHVTSDPFGGIRRWLRRK